MKPIFEDLGIDFGKILSPRIIKAALLTSERSTVTIVSACWIAALVIALLATYTVNTSVRAKNDAAKVVATEPLLPKIVKKPAEASDMQGMMEQLKRRFPAITITLSSDKSLTVSSMDGDRFKEWLIVLGFIDTSMPQYRWSIREMCIGGQCGGATLMRAIMTAEKISFAFPADTSDKKEEKKEDKKETKR